MAGGTLRFLATIVTAIWFHSYCFRYFPIKNFFELTYVIIITGSLPHFVFKDIVILFTFRAVPEKQRAFAMSLNWVFLRFLGN